MGQRSTKWASVLLTVSSVFWTNACFNRADIDVAQRAAEEFHQRVASGNADAIYENASDRYRGSISRDLNRKRFARLRNKMGACPSSTVIAIAVSHGSRETTITARYTTTCSAGTLDESFLWRMVEGKAQLEEFDARSPLLLGD